MRHPGADRSSPSLGSPPQTRSARVGGCESRQSRTRPQPAGPVETSNIITRRRSRLARGAPLEKRVHFSSRAIARILHKIGALRAILVKSARATRARAHPHGMAQPQPLCGLAARYTPRATREPHSHTLVCVKFFFYQVGHEDGRVSHRRPSPLPKGSSLTSVTAPRRQEHHDLCKLAFRNLLAADD